MWCTRSSSRVLDARPQPQDLGELAFRPSYDGEGRTHNERLSVTCTKSACLVDASGMYRWASSGRIRRSVLPRMSRGHVGDILERNVTVALLKRLSFQGFTGATGLEPATSGVTGRSSAAGLFGTRRGFAARAGLFAHCLAGIAGCRRQRPATSCGMCAGCGCCLN